MSLHAARNWSPDKCQRDGSNSLYVQVYLTSKFSSLIVLNLWEKLTKSQLLCTAWLSFLTAATNV